MGWVDFPRRRGRIQIDELYQLLLWRAVYPSSAKSCAAISCECVTNEAIMPQFTRITCIVIIINIIIILLRGTGRLPSKTRRDTLVDLYQLLLWRAVYPSSAKSCAAISSHKRGWLYSSQRHREIQCFGLIAVLVWWPSKTLHCICCLWGPPIVKICTLYELFRGMEW